MVKKSLTYKITTAGILLAIIIIFQLLKNISPYISGPIINTAMILATIELGIWWGVGFSIIVPCLSLIFAPSSAMSLMANATYGVVTITIIIGNLIFAILAYFGRNKKLWLFILFLVIGAVAKWGFMWTSALFIITPLFKDNLGKLVTAVNSVFSILQLYSGGLSIVFIVPIYKVLEKIEKNNS